MRTIRFTVLYAVGLFLVAGCQGQAQGVKPQKLNPDNFEIKLNAIKEGILVDVRTPDEYADGHLPNAMLIDFWGDDFNAGIKKLDKTKPVFVYCKSGGRSAQAADALIEAGFKHVYDLEGGITAWTDARKKIVK